MSPFGATATWERLNCDEPITLTTWRKLPSAGLYRKTPETLFRFPRNALLLPYTLPSGPVVRPDGPEYGPGVNGVTACHPLSVAARCRYSVPLPRVFPATYSQPSGVTVKPSVLSTTPGMLRTNRPLPSQCATRKGPDAAFVSAYRSARTGAAKQHATTIASVPVRQWH